MKTSGLRASVLAGAVSATITLACASGTAALAANGSAASGRSASLAAARKMLEAAKNDVLDARALLRQVEADLAEDGVVSPQTLARVDATPGLTDAHLQTIAHLIDPADPEAALEGASMVNLNVVATGKSARVLAAVTGSGSTIKDPVKAAERHVARTLEQRSAAARMIEQIRNADSADGPGAANLARACADAGVVVDVCTPPRWSEANLLFDAALIGRYVNVNYPEVRNVGGWRPWDGYPDHPSGRAVDIMMPHGGSGPDVPLGNEIAEYFQRHAREYGVQYMIWRQRIWHVGSPVGAWIGMSDRGSATANHLDHVHVTVEDGHSGTAFRHLLGEARLAAA